MIRLSININKVATLGNARGGGTPNVMKVTLGCEAFRTDSVTVHPRPSEHHTRRADIYDLHPLLRTKFSIEGYPSPEFIDLVLKVKPHQVALIPDDPSQVTPNSGWDTKASLEFLSEVLDQLDSVGVCTSVFVTADPEMVEYAARVGTDRMEPYTEPYATAYPKNLEATIAPFVEATKTARKLGIGSNAGHDLSLANLNCFYKNIPWVGEVSIGHALVSDALYLGLEHTIQEYKNCLR